MRRSSSKGFAMLEVAFKNPSMARLVYFSTKPDEFFEERSLKTFSELKGDKIVFKVACKRGLMSLAYTIYEYLQHLRMVEEAISKLEEAMYP
ncbi:MAG: hypothetical protein QXR44_03495 [Thermoproteota archaeon]